jgi:hypothetical protein
MAFKQYTRCIPPSKYVAHPVLLSVIGGVLVGVFAAWVAREHPVCMLIALLVAFMASVVAYCRFTLYQQLLCLDGDRDAIGVIVEAKTPHADFWDQNWDTDYTISLLLQNTEFGVTQLEAQQSKPYGYLIHPQDVIKAEGLPTNGLTAEDAATEKTSAVLHAEFEGAGYYYLLLGAEVGLALAIAALLACLFLPPGLAAILAAILVLLAVIALALGGLLGLNDAASPSDVGVGGDLQTNTDYNNGLGSGADVVYVQGTWIYDPGHDGWNELHPIKVCTKIGCWKGDWIDYDCSPDEPTPPDIILRLRHGFQEAQAEKTKVNQALPQNQWQLHPDLDGCASDVIE